MRFIISEISDANTTSSSSDGTDDPSVPVESDLSMSCDAAFNSTESDFILGKYCKSHMGLIEAEEFTRGEDILNVTLQGIPCNVSLLEILKQYLGISDV